MKKEQTFDEILTSVLETYESNPNQNLDSLISDECNKYGLSDEQVKLLKDVNDYIDSFANKAESLVKAKAEGKSRKRWIMEELDRITEGRDEKEKAQIMSAISNVNEQVVDKMFNLE